MIDPTTPLFVGEFVDLLTSPDVLSRVLIEGLAKASIYLMIASGLTLIFGLMDVINFAHGAFTMYGAYLAGFVILTVAASATGLISSIAVFLVVLGIVFLVLALLGTVLEVTLIRKLYDYPPIFQILLTFGIGITMEELMKMIVEFREINDGHWQFAWRSPDLETLPTTLKNTHDLLFVNFVGLHILQIALGVLTGLAIWLFLTNTRYGLFVRAGVEDEEMAEALGINVKRTFTVVFAIGSGLAGAAGAMLMWDPIWNVSVPLALEVLLPAFVIVIVGGLGSYKGTVVASLIVGMFDAFGSWAFDTGAVEFTALDDLMIFGILVVMLIVLPRGLFGVEGQGDHG